MSNTCNPFKKPSLPAEYQKRWQDPAVIKQVIQDYNTIAMVGVSANETRPSNFVASYLKHHKLDIIPVHPRETSILDIPCYKSLVDIPRPIQVVNIFRRPDMVIPIVEQAIEVKARVVWFQFEVINIEAGELAEKHGLTVVMDRCLKIEHGRYQGGMQKSGFNTGVISTNKRSKK